MISHHHQLSVSPHSHQQNFQHHRHHRPGLKADPACLGRRQSHLAQSLQGHDHRQLVLRYFLFHPYSHQQNFQHHRHHQKFLQQERPLWLVFLGRQLLLLVVLSEVLMRNHGCMLSGQQTRQRLLLPHRLQAELHVHPDLELEVVPYVRLRPLHDYFFVDRYETFYPAMSENHSEPA